MTLHVIPIIIAFSSTLLFIKLVYNFAILINIVDRPNKRKDHIGEVPLIGGLAVIFGFSLACLLSPRSLGEWRPLFLCLIPLAVVGVMDDHGEITIKKRVIVQILTCLVMVFYAKIEIYNFGDLFGLNFNFTSGKLSWLTTVFCVVGVMNSINLIDGIDGLCASICLIAFAAILILVKLTGANASISLILYFGSSLLAFLIVNLGLAQPLVKKVFLGDMGATVIGFLLSWYFIKFSQDKAEILRPITAVWIMALPIMDTFSVMISRFRNQISPFNAGRDHIHHLLIKFGYSNKLTLVILLTVTIMFTTIGVVTEIKKVEEHYMFYGFLFMFILYLYISNKIKNIVET